MHTSVLHQVLYMYIVFFFGNFRCLPFSTACSPHNENFYDLVQFVNNSIGININNLNIDNI
jgi:hypothetical protein